MNKEISYGIVDSSSFKIDTSDIIDKIKYIIIVI